MNVHQLSKALYDRGYDVIPKDFNEFGITEDDTVETAESKILQKNKD